MDAPTIGARPRALSVPPPTSGVARSTSADEAGVHAPSEEREHPSEEHAPTPTTSRGSSRVTLAPTQSGSSLIQTSRQFLRQDEASRTRAFSGAMLVVLALGIACVVVLPGDPLAAKIAGAANGVLTLGFLALWIHARDAARFDPRFVGVTGLFLALASLPVAYYFGVFSPFPCVVALALLMYALSDPTFFVVPVTLLASLGHLALASAIIFGLIEDRGLVTADDSPLLVRLVGAGMVLLVYGTAFVVGRAANRRTRRRIKDLEAAVRQVAAREALLREARQELERAAGIGDPGRFTEQSLGPWLLGNVLGRGGMGEIYEATHSETGEPAALKLLLRGAYAEANPLERFAREAKIAGSLRSPHVVTVLDIGGPESPLPYIAMERLRGEDLAAILRARRRVRPLEARRMTMEVAKALDEAAERAIVHRDLKPSNVFFTTDGHYKVLDFGVSKLIGEAGTLTAGNVVGTPAYMSPEQARGEAVDGRADIYSLAVILYRALTGRPAFTGKDFARMLRSVEETLPPRPSSLVDVPAPVDDVLRVAMAKDRDDRFDRAGELADALGRALDGEVDPQLRARAAELEERLPWGHR